MKLSDFELKITNKKTVKPLIVGGMGVDISTAKLALEIARLGGIGHISDALVTSISDRYYGTKFQHRKAQKFRSSLKTLDKSLVCWDPEEVRAASFQHCSNTMSKKKGDGLIFVNVMEKLAMGAPKETLQARLQGAMDGGIDGITLSAGLHIGSLKLVQDHPRFRDVLFGPIVSSARALRLFLTSAAKVRRMPDYVIVEGPLAGGHLGFGMDWKEYDLRSIVKDVLNLIHSEDLQIPVIAAGGVFTGLDGIDMINMGASGIQVATRFVISKECGFPEHVKQTYLQSTEDDVEVNMTSPTGYPIRMLRSSPSLRSNIEPQCEPLGHILERGGKCSYINVYRESPIGPDSKKLPITDKMCICHHFLRYQCYTCGHYVFRLKDTTRKTQNGIYILPPAEHIFEDYMKNDSYVHRLPETSDENVPASTSKNGEGNAKQAVLTQSQKLVATSN